MSYLSGPDSIVASTVTVKGVGSVGSQLDGPVTSCMLPTLTSLAVQGGLPPIFSLMQRLLLDWANAGVAAAISPPANSSAYRTRWLRMNPRRWLVELVDISFPPAKSCASALIVMVRPAAELPEKTGTTGHGRRVAERSRLGHRSPWDRCDCKDRQEESPGSESSARHPGTQHGHTPS